MSIDQVITFCQSVEAAENNCKELEKTTEVHHIVRQSGSKTAINNCTRCGSTHSINRCPAYGKTCNKCKLLNHFLNQCKSKLDSVPKFNIVKNQVNRKLIKKSFKQNLINTVDSEPEVDNDEHYTILYIINQIGNIKNSNNMWFQMILVNGVKVNFQLDSGAETNILPLEFF